jgi:hypothetical protein
LFSIGCSRGGLRIALSERGVGLNSKTRQWDLAPNSAAVTELAQGGGLTVGGNHLHLQTRELVSLPTRQLAKMLTSKLSIASAARKTAPVLHLSPAVPDLFPRLLREGMENAVTALGLSQ